MTIINFGALAVLAGGLWLASPLQSAPNPPSGDSDGDGLSDVDETTLYGTDPKKFDTDGDGQSDGAEVRAGTNPKLASSAFRIDGLPTKLPNGGWRITWSSISARTYKLQRLDQDQVPVTNSVWLDLVTIAAGGPEASAEDLTAGATSRRFYRVMLVETTLTDSVPPTISLLQASPSPLQSEGVVTLSVTAQDNVGVARVTFFDGETQLAARRT